MTSGGVSDPIAQAVVAAILELVPFVGGSLKELAIGAIDRIRNAELVSLVKDIRDDVRLLITENAELRSSAHQLEHSASIMALAREIVAVGPASVRTAEEVLREPGEDLAAAIREFLEEVHEVLRVADLPTRNELNSGLQQLAEESRRQTEEILGALRAPREHIDSVVAEGGAEAFELLTHHPGYKRFVELISAGAVALRALDPAVTKVFVDTTEVVRYATALLPSEYRQHHDLHHSLYIFEARGRTVHMLPSAASELAGLLEQWPGRIRSHAIMGWVGRTRKGEEVPLDPLSRLVGLIDSGRLQFLDSSEYLEPNGELVRRVFERLSDLRPQRSRNNLVDAADVAAAARLAQESHAGVLRVTSDLILLKAVREVSGRAELGQPVNVSAQEHTWWTWLVDREPTHELRGLAPRWRGLPGARDIASGIALKSLIELRRDCEVALQLADLFYPVCEAGLTQMAILLDRAYDLTPLRVEQRELRGDVAEALALLADAERRLKPLTGLAEKWLGPTGSA